MRSARISISSGVTAPSSVTYASTRSAGVRSVRVGVDGLVRSRERRELDRLGGHDRPGRATSPPPRRSRGCRAGSGASRRGRSCRRRAGRAARRAPPSARRRPRRARPSMSASRSSSAKLCPSPSHTVQSRRVGGVRSDGLAHRGRAGVREHDAVLEARAELHGDRSRGAVAAVEQRAGLVEHEPAQLARAERPAAGRRRRRAVRSRRPPSPSRAGRRRGRGRRRPGARAAPRRPPRVPRPPERASRRHGAPASCRRENGHGAVPRSGRPEGTRARSVSQRAGVATSPRTRERCSVGWPWRR